MPAVERREKNAVLIEHEENEAQQIDRDHGRDHKPDGPQRCLKYKPPLRDHTDLTFLDLLEDLIFDVVHAT